MIYLVFSVIDRHHQRLMLSDLLNAVKTSRTNPHLFPNLYAGLWLKSGLAIGVFIIIIVPDSVVSPSLSTAFIVLPFRVLRL